MHSALWHEFLAVVQSSESRILHQLASPLAEIAGTPAKRATLSASYRTAVHTSIRERVQNKSPSMSLERLLVSSLTLESTDPRDKVYALMGLAHASNQANLVPDSVLNSRST
jgi:hypothetical protein